MRVTGRMAPVDDLSVRLTPSACEYLGTVQDLKEERGEADILRHLPGPDEDHAPVSAIRAMWGEGAPSETALYDQLKRLVEEFEL